MKAWIRDNYYMEKIPAKRLRDNALLHIFPVIDDPAEQIPSQRDDGIETIEWHGEKYEVFSIDLTWKNSPIKITPYVDIGRKPLIPFDNVPTKEFVDALIDYTQDSYENYDGDPVEFEYEDIVYPYEYYINYLPPSVGDYPREQGRD